MKYVVLILLFFCSCAKQETAITNVVYENNKINSEYLDKILTPEKALLTWYLYAYGNECDNGGQSRQDIHRHVHGLLEARPWRNPACGGVGPPPDVGFWSG